MKKFIFVLCITFAVMACSHDKMKGNFDLKGRIVEVNQSQSSILINAGTENIWIALPSNMNIASFQEGQEVVVWVEGEIEIAVPQSAKVLNIEIISPSPGT